MAFLYETPFLDLEIYRLIAVLESSPALAEFRGRYETDRNKVEFLRGVEFPEVSRIVVSLAAIIRSAGVRASSIVAHPLGFPLELIRCRAPVLSLQLEDVSSYLDSFGIVGLP